MKRDTRLFSINNIPLLIYDSPECISDDIVKYNNFWEFELFNKWKHYFPILAPISNNNPLVGNYCFHLLNYSNS